MNGNDGRKDHQQNERLLQRLARETSVPQRVVVLRALPGLGDFLCAVPALRALRRALPKAQIDLLGLPSTGELVGRYIHYIDNLIPLPGYPGLPEQPPQVEALPDFLAMMQARRYDLAIQLQGDGSIVNELTLMLGARYSAGFHLPDRYCPDDETFLPYPTTTHEIRRNLALLKFLGAPAEDETIEFLLTPGDHKAFERLARATGLRPGRYACIHAGASTPVRRWSPDAFALCARMLHQRGLQLVLTGTQAEAEMNADLAHHIGEPLLDLSGETNLGVLACLLKQARLLLCNDTGVSHLAVATKTASVVVFLGTERGRWAPLNRLRHITVGAGDGTGVSTSQVWSALQTIMARHAPPAMRTSSLSSQQALSVD